MNFISITVDIPLTRVADLLCTAFEGGVGYWCTIVNYVEPTGAHPPIDRELGFVGYMDYPIREGGAVVLRDDQDGKKYTLDLDALRDGFQVMREKCPQHFSDFIIGNEDAETGDVFVQCCIFGEVVY